MKQPRSLAAPPLLGLAAVLLMLVSIGGRPAEEPFAGSLCPSRGDRVAIAALGDHAGAEVSALAGRTPFYLLFEAGSDRIVVVPNTHSKGERSVGAHAAYLLSELEVDCLVAGAVGARMRAVLEAEGIAFHAFEGTADAAAAKALELGTGTRATTIDGGR